MKTTLNYNEKMLEKKEKYGVTWVTLANLGLLFIEGQKVPFERLHSELDSFRDELNAEIGSIRRRLFHIERKVFGESDVLKKTGV